MKNRRRRVVHHGSQKLAFIEAQQKRGKAVPSIGGSSQIVPLENNWVYDGLEGLKTYPVRAL